MRRQPTEARSVGSAKGQSGATKEPISLARFIVASSKQIVSEWEEFARTAFPEGSVEERRDHIEGMLKAIGIDLEKPQTTRQQTQKSRGIVDRGVGADTAANAHGTDRAAKGFTPVQMVSEFRALRASVLRLWSEAQTAFTRAHLQEVTRFNEAIDQMLAESIAQYATDVDRSKDLFVGVLGHDLRNPLGAIMMGASLMLRQEGADWRHARTASSIVRSGTRMDAMIRDLLDFTRTRLGSGIPVTRAKMDMAEICRQTIEEITAFHPECVVLFSARGKTSGEWDSGRVAQALSNLVGNARQHGSKDAPVSVAVRGERGRVILTVHNRGPVIASRHLQEIFSPFRQLEPAHAKARDLRSLGLGLYIVQGIVLAHHGTVGVASNEKGTTFTVCLPRSVAHASDATGKKRPALPG